MSNVPEEGTMAPDFEAKNQDGKSIKLSDFKGKHVILYFYPKDDTPGCTAEACNLRDNYEDLKKEGFEVIGVSSDSAASHQKFIAKYDLPFQLVADEDKSVHEKYGTWVEKNMYGRKYMGTNRNTFVINPEGKVVKVFKKVESKSHTEQIREAMAKL
jgi:thioredoxin-dependent peroxiredoxin